MVEGNTWRVKLEARDTVEDVCRRLSKKIDEKYKIVELYIIGSSMCDEIKQKKQRKGTKIEQNINFLTEEPLQGDHNMLDVLQGLETSQRKFGLLYKIDASDISFPSLLFLSFFFFFFFFFFTHFILFYFV